MTYLDNVLAWNAQKRVRALKYNVQVVMMSLLELNNEAWLRKETSFEISDEALQKMSGLGRAGLVTEAKRQLAELGAIEFTTQEGRCPTRYVITLKRGAKSGVKNGVQIGVKNGVQRARRAKRDAEKMPPESIESIEKEKEIHKEKESAGLEPEVAAALARGLPKVERKNPLLEVAARINRQLQAKGSVDSAQTAAIEATAPLDKTSAQESLKPALDIKPQVVPLEDKPSTVEPEPSVPLEDKPRPTTALEDSTTLMTTAETFEDSTQSIEDLPTPMTTDEVKTIEGKSRQKARAQPTIAPATTGHRTGARGFEQSVETCAFEQEKDWRWYLATYSRSPPPVKILGKTGGLRHVGISEGIARAAVRGQERTGNFGGASSGTQGKGNVGTWAGNRGGIRAGAH